MRRFSVFNDRGFSLLAVMITFVFVLTSLGLLLNFLGDSFKFSSRLRNSALTKKSFGGAEQVLINQRQCRCNFLNLPTFKENVSPGTVMALTKIQTYQDVETCVPGPADEVLSDTTSPVVTGVNYYYKAEAINLTKFQILIPRLLYRAELDITPIWGVPVAFPILLATEPDNVGNVKVKICGVDRAT